MNNDNNNINMNDDPDLNIKNGVYYGKSLFQMNADYEKENKESEERSEQQFKTDLDNGKYDTPNDPKDLDGLVKFIQANDSNFYINVQPEPDVTLYHSQDRDLRTNIYVDPITYAKLMEKLGSNPADNY